MYLNVSNQSDDYAIELNIKLCIENKKPLPILMIWRESRTSQYLAFSRVFTQNSKYSNFVEDWVLFYVFLNPLLEYKKFSHRHFRTRKFNQLIKTTDFPKFNVNQHHKQNNSNRCVYLVLKIKTPTQIFHRNILIKIDVIL